jgi:hypothetical protein
MFEIFKKNPLGKREDRKSIYADAKRKRVT